MAEKKQPTDPPTSLADLLVSMNNNTSFADALQEFTDGLTALSGTVDNATLTQQLIAAGPKPWEAMQNNTNQPPTDPLAGSAPVKAAAHASTHKK